MSEAEFPRSSGYQPRPTFSGAQQAPEDVDSEIEMVTGLGIPPEDAANYSVGGVAREDIMDYKEAMKKWDAMCEQWHPPDSKAKVLVLNSLLLYLAMNAPSPRGSYSGSLEVLGREYPMSVFNDVIMGRHRQFHRVFVETGRMTKILKSNPSKAMEMARKNGYPDRLAFYAYDTSPYAPGIPPGTREELFAFKRNKLSSLPAYTEISTARARKPQPVQTPSTYVGTTGNLPAEHNGYPY